MHYKKRYLMKIFLILFILLMVTGCSRKTYKIDYNRSIVLDKEYNEFRDGEIRYGYDIYDSTITLYYPEGYRFTYNPRSDDFAVFDGHEDEYLEVKGKYADPDELIKIIQSQPEHKGVLGFMGMMIAGIGLITYFYPDMFYAIRSRGKFHISERE